MGGIVRLGRKKLFLFKTVKIYKASDEFLHILVGEVPLLTGVGQTFTLRRCCFTWGYKPHRIRDLPTHLS